MILYSIVPSEVVFGDYSANPVSASMEMDYMGYRVQVSALPNNQYVINRLISTSPKAYLDPRLQPGTVIRK